MCPEVVLDGTLMTMLVPVAEVGATSVALSLVLSFAMLVSKLVPLIVRDVPGRPMPGVNPVMVGAPPPAAVTVNGLLLVTERSGLVRLMVIGPVVAPVGTVVTIWLTVAEVTVAATPLNVTVFWVGVALNPVPKIVTLAPTGPLVGVNPIMERSEEV